MLAVGLPFLLVAFFMCRQFASFDSLGLNDGFSHPLTGWDHLITMLAVGIWAAQLRGQAIWMLPLAFVGVMSLGGIAGASGISIPSSEGIILLSAAVFSVLISRKMRFSAKINVLIVAFFAFFHGFAHGHEISTSASLLSYTLGFMLATLLLHGTGILVAKLIVFCAACLLTLIFSNLAVAKSAEWSNDGKVKTTALAQCKNLPNDHSLRKGRPSTDSHARCLLFKQTLDIESDSGHIRAGLRPAFAGGGTLDFGGDASGTASKSSLKVFKNRGYDTGLTLEQSALQAAYPLAHLSSFCIEYPNIGKSDFNDFFPDINHSPGRHFLTNGVGLASPPSVSIPQNTFPLRKPRFPSLEDKRLQSIFAPPHIGNVFDRTINRNINSATPDSRHAVKLWSPVKPRRNCTPMRATNNPRESKDSTDTLLNPSELHEQRALRDKSAPGFVSNASKSGSPLSKTTITSNKLI